MSNIFIFYFYSAQHNYINCTCPSTFYSKARGQAPCNLLIKYKVTFWFSWVSSLQNMSYSSKIYLKTGYLQREYNFLHKDKSKDILA